MTQLDLISFDLCPYVQRSAITLLHKRVPFTTTHIDLASPPAWFAALSPLGKVPVLRIDGKEVLFESAVINEYVDEITPPSLLPSTPLAKARERAWIEMAGEAIGLQYPLFTTDDAGEITSLTSDLFDLLERVEEALAPEGPYFRGAEFGLVDTAWAPFFMRLELSPKWMNRDDVRPRWNRLTRVQRWTSALAGVEAVRASVIPTFREKYVDYCRKTGSPLF